MTYCGKCSAGKHEIGTEFLVSPSTRYVPKNKSQFSFFLLNLYRHFIQVVSNLRRQQVCTLTDHITIFIFHFYFTIHSSSELNYLAQHPAHNEILANWLWDCFEAGVRRTGIWSSKDLSFLISIMKLNHKTSL